MEKYFFPTHWVSIEAKSLEEAQEKLKSEFTTQKPSDVWTSSKKSSKASQ